MSGTDNATDDSVDPLDVSADDDFLYYLREGGEALKRGAAPEARKALERAFELNPESPRVQNLLGLAYFKLGLLEAAKSIYDRLISEYAEEAPLRVNMGLVLLRQGRLVEAEEALRSALELSPDHERAHCYLGLVLYRRGDLVRAKEHFSRGGAPEFADKVQRKLEEGISSPAQSDLLSMIAEDGLARLEDGQDSLQPLVPTEDERSIRDESAWQTRTGHNPLRDSLDLEELAELTSAGPVDELSASPGFPVTGSIPIELSEPPTPRVPNQVAYGSGGPSSGEVTPIPEVPVAQLGLPRLTPQPSFLSSLPWEPGFRTPMRPASDVWLTVGGRAHVRSSTIVAAHGDLRILEAAIQSSTNPFIEMRGQGRVLVRVPNVAAVVHDAPSLFCRASALAGFEGAYEHKRGEVLGSAIIHLEGEGTVLLNAPRRALVARVEAGMPLYLRRDSFLAWTPGVDSRLVEAVGLPEGLVLFRGEGLVMFAGSDEVGGAAAGTDQ